MKLYKVEYTTEDCETYSNLMVGNSAKQVYEDFVEENPENLEGLVFTCVTEVFIQDYDIIIIKNEGKTNTNLEQYPTEDDIKQAEYEVRHESKGENNEHKN